MNKLMNMMGYIRPSGKVDWSEIRVDAIVLGVVVGILYFVLVMV